MQEILYRLEEFLAGFPDLAWGVSGTGFSPFSGEYPSAAVLALKYTGSLPGRYEEAAYHELLEKTRDRCNGIASDIKRILEDGGIAALVPQPGQTSEEELKAPFPFKRAAVEAGLGWIGKSGVLVTHRFGPRIVLRAVLAGASLPHPQPEIKSLCGDCTACMDACPWGFIRGTDWEPGVEREALLDYHACNRERKKSIGRLGRKHTCGRCILACPRGS
jgi:epoxyqueuosine reductase